MRYSWLLIATILTFLVPAGPASAQPLISGISVQPDGRTVAISGSGFGVKAQAAPVKWDTFDNGTNGNRLQGTDPSWVPYYQGTKYSSAQAHSGGLSVKTDVYTYDNPDSAMCSNYFVYSPGSDELFVTYWWRAQGMSPTMSTVVKMARLGSRVGTGSDGVYNGAGNMQLGNGAGGSGSTSRPFVTYTPVAGSITGLNDLYPNYGMSPLPGDQWIRVEQYIKLSTPGVADGAVEARIYGMADGVRAATSRMTRGSGQTFKMNSVLLATMDGSAGAKDYQIHVDDVYIDTTRARVELCDSPTWAGRTHCEIQPAVSWSSNAINVTFNDGSFAPSAATYFYVVDSQGNANAIGASAGVRPPTNVKIIVR